MNPHATEPCDIDAIACRTTGRYANAVIDHTVDLMMETLRFRGKIFMHKALWHEAMSEIIGQAMAHKTKHLFFLDGDSVPVPADVVKMYRVIEQNPMMDAIFATEAHRQLSVPMAHRYMEGHGMTYSHNDTVTRQPMGHFGCTFIRRDVFESMARPWFLHQPGRDGDYREFSPGKINDDAYFWMKRWNTREKDKPADEQRFVVQHNTCCVGHAAEMVRFQCGGVCRVMTLEEFLTVGAPPDRRCPNDEEWKTAQKLDAIKGKPEWWNAIEVER